MENIQGKFQRNLSGTFLTADLKSSKPWFQIHSSIWYETFHKSLVIVLFFILKYATFWRSWVPWFGVESRFLLFKFIKLARLYYPMPPCFSIKAPWNLFESSTSEEKPESPCWTLQVRRYRWNITWGLWSVNQLMHEKVLPLQWHRRKSFDFTSSRKDGSWMIFRGSFKTPHTISEVKIQAELLLFLPILSS